MSRQASAAPQLPVTRTGAPHSAVEAGARGGEVASPVAYLTTSEAAAIIRVDTEYVTRQCAAGNIAAKKVGKEWRIHPDDLDAFMRGKRISTGGGKAPPTRPGRKRAR